MLTSRTSLTLITLLALTLSPALGQAFGPSSWRGLDVNTVVALRDQARAMALAEREAESGQAQGATLTKLRTIVLDPGHGGENQGALGVAEVHEKFLTLALAYQLRDTLQARYPGVRVVLTRYWDRELGLSERVHVANRAGADLFISLHYNSATHQRAVGVETYFLAADAVTPGAEAPQGAPLASASMKTTGLPEPSDLPRHGTHNDAMLVMQRDLDRQAQHRASGALAEIVQRQLIGQLQAIDRGVKQANFGVLRGALMPAVVVEAGFVSHPREGKALTREQHRAKTVEALMSAIIEFDALLASAP